MSRSLRIPGLVDLIRTDARSEIRDLAVDGRLDRRFEARGPLVNRILLQRVRSVLRVDGVPLPSVAPRGDAGAPSARRRSRRGSIRRRDAAVGRGDASSAWSAQCAARRRSRARRRRRSRRSGGCSSRTTGRRSKSWAAAVVLDTRGADPQSAARAVPHRQRPAAQVASAARRARQRRPRRGCTAPASPCTISCAASSGCASCGTSRRRRVRSAPMRSSRMPVRAAEACCARPPCPARPSPARCARARSSCLQLDAAQRAQRRVRTSCSWWEAGRIARPHAFVPGAACASVWERAVAEEADEARP